MSKSTKNTSPKQKSTTSTSSAEQMPVLSINKDIQRQTRRQYSVYEKIRIVLEGLQGEQSVSELCRWEGLNPNVYYRWIGPPKRQRVFRSW